VKYQFFARILALCRVQIITNQNIHMASLHSITSMCMVWIVIIRARHSAKFRAKSLIVSEKTISIIAHLCSEMAVSDRNSTFRLHRSIRYSRAKHAVLFYLRNRTTAHREYLMSSTANNLLELWVCKLSFLKRHPSIQKAKNMKHCALCWESI
jgi:hypothetical protein